MKRPRLRRRWLVTTGLLLLPPLFWASALALVPMDWAQRLIVDRLARATGRPVGLDGVRIGFLGGIQLTNLRIGAPGSADDPWLRVHLARLDVSLLQLLFRRVEPTRIVVDGAYLRILRRPDGRLELADLLEPSPDPRPEGDADDRPEGDAGEGEPRALDVQIRGGQLAVIDRPTGSSLDVRGIEGRGSWAGDSVTVHELRGMLNGGTLRLAARLDRGASPPAFQGEIEARGTSLGEGMKALGYLVPVLDGATDSLTGTLDLHLAVQGEGLDRETVLGSLTGSGSLRIDPIALDRSRWLADLSSLLEIKPGGRLGSLRSDFEIRNRRVGTQDLTLDVGKTPIVLSGWTDFDRRVDYRVRVDRLAQRLPSEAREILADLDLDLARLSVVCLRGTLDELEVGVDRNPLSHRPPGASKPKGPRDDRRRLQELTRRLRDRILQ